eukprot:3170408-Rhodomonas_salina.1
MEQVSAGVGVREGQVRERGDPERDSARREGESEREQGWGVRARASERRAREKSSERASERARE